MEESFMARANLLDPSAQEFYPQFALQHPQIYYPYPPPPLPLPPPPPFPSHYVRPPQATDDASSRAVVLSMVPPHVTEPTLTQAMMSFGGVRAVETQFLMSEGIVTVHFYDLRSAQVAVAEIREQHVRQQSWLGQQLYGFLTPPPPIVPGGGGGGRGLIEGQAVWAQFAAKDLDVLNQGLLFVTVSDPAAVSSDFVRDIFQGFGPVKEVRESSARPHHKFVEFFDVRDAARALAELTGKEIGGVRLFVEFSRPGGVQSRSYINHHHHHHHKRSGHQNLPLPPRLARSNSQASSSSSSRGNQVAGEADDARISNVSRNGNAVKRNKASRSSNYPTSSSSTSKKQQQQQQMSKKSWKNHGKSSNMHNFEFKEKEMEPSGSISSSSSSSCRDSRTTVMIKNIPNKYSQKLLLNMLDNHCIHCNEQIEDGGGEEPFSAFDFVYLPIDFNNKCNVGYGFVNLTSPEATVRLYRAFHMQPWEVFNSRKICQVTYARLQGLEALKEHFKNSKFACDNDEYMPVVFDPPRDGKQLTEPVPIGGQHLLLPLGVKIRAGADLGGASSTTASTQAPSDQEAADDDDDDNNDDRDGDGDGDGDGGSDEIGSLQLLSLSAAAAAYAQD